MATKRRNSKRKKEFIQTVTFFFISIFSITGLLIYLWVYNEINLSIRDVSALEKIEAGLVNDNKLLTNAIARLERIDRITGIARNELGMVTAAPETIIVYVDYDAIGWYND
ncbi:MAG: hypothetical protein HQ562_10595 [Candidatus Marinimicrobia bacterium]|nr:hypothetical protein [Candidatus Neomarinimicrobiota bacterium]